MMAVTKVHHHSNAQRVPCTLTRPDTSRAARQHGPEAYTVTGESSLERKGCGEGV